MPLATKHWNLQLLRNLARLVGIQNLTIVIRHLDLPPHRPKRLPEGVLSVMDVVDIRDQGLKAIIGNFLLDMVNSHCLYQSKMCCLAAT